MCLHKMQSIDSLDLFSGKDISAILANHCSHGKPQMCEYVCSLDIEETLVVSESIMEVSDTATMTRLL